MYDAGGRVDELLALVRQRGGRVTTCRRAVIAALIKLSPGHPSADDLAEQVRASHPDIHRSTIYRSLSDLEELGVVEHVHLGHGRAVYHLAGDEHQHAVCQACGGVVEVEAAAFAPLAAALEREFGFELGPGHFALAGRCSACRAQS